MAMCTKCGAVINDADIKTHKCKEENIPSEKEEVIAGVKTTISVVK